MNRNSGEELTSRSVGPIKFNRDAVACTCGAVECDADSWSPCAERDSLGQSKASGKAENVLHVGGKKLWDI